MPSYQGTRRMLLSTVATVSSLGALALSSPNAAAGSPWSATVMYKTPGTTLSAVSSDGTPLTVGNTSTDGLYGTSISGTFTTAGNPTITLIETPQSGPSKSTNVTLPVLAPLGPMAASQAPVAIYAFRRINSAYAGNCIQARDSSNTLRTLAFNTDGTLNTTGLSGFGDGVTFGVATWYDQSGSARDLTTASRPYLQFGSNYATLVNAPTINAAGGGYSVGDVLTPTGGIVAPGGQAAQIRVAAVLAGAIMSVTVIQAGKYVWSPSPTNNATGVTGGTGTGATFTWALTGNAGNTYTAPRIEWMTTGGLSLATAATFLNVGGTVNLGVFVVGKRLGYGSATTPFARPGASSTSNQGVMLGYGTTATGILLNSASLGVTSPFAQADPTSASGLRDNLGQSAAAYGMGEVLPIEEAAPSATSDNVNLWFNQSGATITAGGDTRRHWSNRAHGVTAATAQRLTVGAAGSLALTHNGSISELIIYQGASPLSDTEAQQIAIGQQQLFGAQATVNLPRYFIALTGQSNANGHMSYQSSGSTAGGVNSASALKAMVPAMAAALGTTTNRILYGFQNRTAVGGMPLLKRPNTGDPNNPGYFWDEDTSSGGTLAVSLQCPNSPTVTAGGTGHAVGDVLTITGGTLYPGGAPTSVKVATISGSAVTSVTVLIYGQYVTPPASPAATTSSGAGTGCTLTPAWSGGVLPYLQGVPGILTKRVIFMHAQGEQDAATVTTTPRVDQWAQQTAQYIKWLASQLGLPTFAAVVQPLARYGVSGGATFDPSATRTRQNMVNYFRRWQQEYVGQQPGIFLAADTGHCARGTIASTNFDAHFGAEQANPDGTVTTGYETSTGGPEDGYQRVAYQDGLALAYAVRKIYAGVDDPTIIYRGPEVIAATKSSSTTIDLTVSYPPNCAGSDITSSNGTLAGFRVFTGPYASPTSEVTNFTSTARINANTIRLTFGLALPAGANLAYEPNYAQSLQQVRDNNALSATWPGMPLNMSSVYAIN